MRSQRFSMGLCAALAAAGASLSAPAAAQTQPPLALDRFDPAPAGDRMFGVQSAYVAGHLTPHVTLLGDYAHNPLVLRTTSDGKSVGAVVSSQLFLHLNASLALFDRLNVNLDVPVALFQAGDDPSGGGLRFTSPKKAQFGDLRAGLRLRLFGGYDDAFQLAVGGYVWFPTGSSEAYVSDGKVRGMPQLIVGGRTDRLVWSVAGGPELTSATTFAGVPQGTLIKVGGGVGVLLGERRRLQIGPELSLALTPDGIGKRTTNAEVLVDVRYRVFDDIEVGLGAGPGITGGIGTPDLRAVAMISYSPEHKTVVPDRDRDGVFDSDDACPDVAGVPDQNKAKNGCPLPVDRDQDGIVDADDACPDVPGVGSTDRTKNGCPVPLDRDKDGFIDSEDACPDEPGIQSDDKAKNGCPKPPDRDGDGVPDAKDACPDVKGIATQDAATNGCPEDIDGDGIKNDKDACPNEKGPADKDPTKNGCPKSVRVTDGEIIILQQVQFDSGRATIKKVSDALLDEVAGVFKEHLEITVVEIQGHTDNTGKAKDNLKLSQDRAESVKKALVKRGIDDARLVPKGYGQEVPIADNKTEATRQKNRRVQFKIQAKAPRK
jgi:outer membrane protein OmpA-like peptidoglycan-associated protein